MKSIFLTYIYPIMRVIALTVILTGCGSVQTINGVKVPRSNDKPNFKNYCLVGVSCFAFGYYLGKNVLPQKKN